MGDPSKFINTGLFYSFHIALLLMILAEIFIIFYTYQKKTGNEKVSRADRGTRWLLMLNFYICVYVSFLLEGHHIPTAVRSLRLPAVLSYLGVVMMFLGVAIRLWAVMTLKRAFTLSVQTTESQHLITTGIYRKIRNPAYLGSICSLMGAAMGLRNIISLFLVLLLSFFAYSARISVEEKALTGHFGEEFLAYKKNTCRVIPFLW